MLEFLSKLVKFKRTYKHQYTGLLRIRGSSVYMCHPELDIEMSVDDIIKSWDLWPTDIEFAVSSKPFNFITKTRALTKIGKQRYSSIDDFLEDGIINYAITAEARRVGGRYLYLEGRSSHK